MAPKLTADEIDDLIYLARAGEDAELTVLLKELADREKITIADVLDAAKDESGATCLHMAAANGHSSKCILIPNGSGINRGMPVFTAFQCSIADWGFPL